MKINYISKNMLFPPLEGHHIASKNIIEASISSGIESKIYSIEKKITTNYTNNMTIINSKIKSKINYSFLNGFYLALDDLITSFEISKHIKTENPDVVHLLNVNKEAYIISKFFTRINKPICLHLYHSPYVLSDDIFLVRKLFFKLQFYRGIKKLHLLATNASLKKYLVDENFVDYENVHIIPYPIDIERFKPITDKEYLREKYGLPLDKIILVYVGSLDPTRGIFTLIHALSHVLVHIPDVVLYISHPDRSGEDLYLTALKRLLIRLNIVNDVIITGPKDNIEEVYNLADYVVLPFSRPYWIDPPMVLLEAMSCGSVIITTPTGSISDVLKNRENAIFIESGKPLDLGELLIEVINNRKYNQRYGRKARKIIESNYSYSIIGKKLNRLYHMIA